MTQYKIAQESKTLQQLFSTRGTIIQVGKKECIKIKKKITDTIYYDFQKYFVFEEEFHDLNMKNPTFKDHVLLIPVMPSFFVVNDDFEVWSDNDVFHFKLDSDGVLSFVSGKLVSNDLSGNYTIEKVQIQDNIIWIWEDGKPYKRYFYAMDERILRDATTFEPIGFISEIQIIPSL